MAYTAKFRTEAVALAKEVGTVSASRQLGISDSTLGGWVRRDRAGTLPDDKPRTKQEEMEAENRMLRKKLRETERGNVPLHRLQTCRLIACLDERKLEIFTQISNVRTCRRRSSGTLVPRVGCHTARVSQMAEIKGNLSEFVRGVMSGVK